MSERLTIVVPDGTVLKLTEEAKKQKRSRSNLSMKYILDGLNGAGQLVGVIRGKDIEHILDRSRK